MLEQQEIQSFVKSIKRQFGEHCKLDTPLAPYTTYNVGGKADALVFPERTDDLEQLVRACKQKRIPFFIIGKGANILVHDNGFRGVVISLEQCCSQIFYRKNLLYVGAGQTVKNLVEYCEEHGLEGLEFMSGIPGTVGGALQMNAGAYGGEIGDRVMRIDLINERGVREQIPTNEAGFGYRRADGLKEKILLGCWLHLGRGKKAVLEQVRREIIEKRTRRQPLEFPSCGSVFKRPPGDYAGRLIEEAGAKGLRIGGAMVSPKHANFIVNYRNATARDIYDVIVEVQNLV
ncbi:MAG: UDP-N-acetylmuramate dehydrogenase, partial [Calditrichia bacterium]